MRVAISRSLLDALIAEAAKNPDREICGLLFGTGDRIDAAKAAANVASNPVDSFEIDPQSLFEAIRAERGGGPRVIGCYHSHPSGPAEPSRRDAEAAAPDGRLWLILGGDKATAWRAVAQGTHLGRFDPVALTPQHP